MWLCVWRVILKKLVVIRGGWFEWEKETIHRMSTPSGLVFESRLSLPPHTHTPEGPVGPTTKLTRFFRRPENYSFTPTHTHTRREKEPNKNQEKKRQKKYYEAWKIVKHINSEKNQIEREKEDESAGYRVTVSSNLKLYLHRGTIMHLILILNDSKFAHPYLSEVTLSDKHLCD